MRRPRIPEAPPHRWLELMRYHGRHRSSALPDLWRPARVAPLVVVRRAYGGFAHVLQGRGGATTSRSMRPSPCPHRAVRGGPCESRSRHLGIKSRPRCFPAAVVGTLGLLLHKWDAFGPVGLPCPACATGRNVRKPDHPLDQGLCAGRRPRRLPSSRCDDAGPEVSCGPSSTLACVSCSSWSSYSFAAGAPRRPNSSPCAMKWKFFGARWGVPPTSPPIARSWPPSVDSFRARPGQPSV